MSSYKELLSQRAELEAKIEAARQAEISAAVQLVKEKIEEFGLTADDLFGSRKTRAGKPTGKVAAKYRDPRSGATWTGRGKPPRWIADKDRAQFTI